MASHDNTTHIDKPLKSAVRQWLGFAFALLAFAFPTVWFISEGSVDWMVRVMFVLFLLSIRQKASLIYYKDSLIWLCVLLVLMLVAGYIWQRFSVPEALLSGSSPAREYIPAFCFFVVIAYGINATPKASPFLLLISAGAGLFIHLSFVPADIWLAGWQGHRMGFGFSNAQHAGIMFSTALLAGIFFLPRAFSLPFRMRVLVLPLLVGFIVLMIFGVIATQTRAVWLGLVFSSVTLLLSGAVLLFTGRSSGRWRELTRMATVGTGVLLAGLAMLHFMTGSSITQRLAGETVDTATIMEMARLETVPRSSIGVRIGSWSAAREWIAERPVFGWGGNTGSKLIKQSPYFDEKFKNRYGHLHNSYLETLVAVGGAAVACMLAIIFLVTWRITVAWHQGRIPTDVFLFSCAFFPFWATANIFESYIVFSSGFFLNATILGFVYSWYLRSQYNQMGLNKIET